MKSVSAAEFKKKTGTYQDMALSEPVMITKHERPALVLMSYAEYQKLSGHIRKAAPPAEMGDLPRVSIEAMKMAKIKAA